VFNVEYCKSLVLGLPITVEKYPSGQVGFVARPMVDGRRHNRSFATSKFGTPENAAQSAIEFCKEVEKGAHAERLTRREAHPIPQAILPDISFLVGRLISMGIDPVKVLSEAAAAGFRKKVGS
jgi:hypothetical protein